MISSNGRLQPQPSTLSTMGHYSHNDEKSMEVRLRTTLFVGGFVALLTGVAIGVQATLSSRTGALIGNIQTGLLTSVCGGAIGLIAVGAWYAWRPSDWQLTGAALTMLVIAGGLGIAIITGISFSLQRVGVVAGLAALIFGQLAISVLIDSQGVAGVEPIPLTSSRVVGLLVMAVSVYLLLPRGP